jgi:hypothetical protein
MTFHQQNRRLSHNLKLQLIKVSLDDTLAETQATLYAHGENPG